MTLQHFNQGAFCESSEEPLLVEARLWRAISCSVVMEGDNRRQYLIDYSDQDSDTS